ncbi:NADH-quinone oxidoreductase subunit NuoE [Ornithinimicrobium pratense]|uniref:NADH-quinone oxidoreductase subunit NuoE n=1 Tax=Ornithinimicrobium pratense TaxID=2593973 RepID=A0A5J6VAK8_9MICO|nr:NADH-quinone oxidoreductase subunit NuoE [Ornithinimicrobium pratense]QFG70323.1 NADH-quinone oxidoreductase subunit NuoE [Ornithinimicrobium pratense]
MFAPSPLHPQAPLRASDEPYPPDVLERMSADAAKVISRYPQQRSALLPLLHLVQSVDGYITGRGVHFCAEQLGLTTAEVSGVATFYTQYKRHPNGDYTVGVCTNTLCAIMGGDQLFEELSEYLGIGHDETTEDGKITLERVECNAACDFAPVVMVNWEFFDNQTPESARQVVDRLRAGEPVAPTRGPSRVGTFKEVSRVLAGFTDGRADEGVGAGPASLQGTLLAQKMGWSAPGGTDGDAVPDAQQTQATPAGQEGGLDRGRPSSADTPSNRPDEQPGGGGPAGDARPVGENTKEEER